MKRKLKGLVRLARCREYLWFVIITTLLGAKAANGHFGLNLMGVLVANWLAVGFAFMINDVEDAPDDALDPQKVKRNPVSAADLSPRAGWAASLVVAGLSALAYGLLGFWPFVVGSCCLVIGFLYSWRPVRLKNIAFLDMLSHCLMLAGLQFLAAYFTFEQTGPDRWLAPFLFIVAISLYGELFNELRDLEGDLKAGLTHTASLLGARITYWLMMAVFFAGIGSALVTVFVVRLIPAWVLLLLVALAAVLITPPLFKLRQNKSHLELQQSFQKPLEIAAALALLSEFIILWALPLLPWKFF